MLNKNDEYLFSKLFEVYLFNVKLLPEFEQNKLEIQTLSQFYKGYWEHNYAISKRIWKESKDLLSLIQPNEGSFLPLGELWLIKPILFIETNGPPPITLNYVKLPSLIK